MCLFLSFIKCFDFEARETRGKVYYSLYHELTVDDVEFYKSNTSE